MNREQDKKKKNQKNRKDRSDSTEKRSEKTLRRSRVSEPRRPLLGNPRRTTSLSDGIVSAAPSKEAMRVVAEERKEHEGLEETKTRR